MKTQNVNSLLPTSEQDFKNYGEPGLQATGVNHLDKRINVPQTTACNSQGLLLC